MVKLFMQKEVLYSHRLNNVNLETRVVSRFRGAKRKKIVNINKLLNRVKFEQQSEKKKKFIFLSLGFLFLCSVGTLLSI